MATTTNVGFKIGSQESLKKLTAVQLQAGSFYLTNDSHRLFFAQDVGGTNLLFDLNKYAKIYDTLDSLKASATNAEEGDFAYIKDGNIFAVYITKKGESAPSWIQVNTPTELVETEKATTVTKSGDDVVVSTSISDTRNKTASGSFKIVAGTGVEFKVDTDTGAITIDATGVDTQYTLYTGDTTKEKNNTAVITLGEKTGTDPKDVASVTIQTPKDTDSVSYSKRLKIESDDDGNVTLEVPQLVDTLTTAFGDDGKLNITLNGTDEVTNAKSVVTPTIAYGKEGANKQVFKSGTATLSVYTMEETDSLVQEQIKASLQTADAMHFAGTVGAEGSGATTNTLPDITTVGNGETYKVVSNNYIDGAKIGDLVISFGDEDDDGLLSSGGKWVIVPSGDDLTIVGDVSDLRVAVRDSAGNVDIAGAKFTGVDNNPVKVTGKANATKDATETTITIEHNTIGTGVADGDDITQTNYQSETNYTTEITAITGMTVDSYGHVTEATKQKITLVDTHNHLSEDGVTVETTKLTTSDNSSALNIATSVSMTDGDIQTGSYQLNSTSLDLSADASGNATVNLVWGTF